MGWEDAKPIDLAKSIVKQRATDEILKASSQFIFIYHVPSRKAQSMGFIDSVLQIDVMVPTAGRDKADRVVDRIIHLLTKQFLLNNRSLQLDATVGDSPAPTGFYCCSVRFNYFCSV